MATAPDNNTPRRRRLNADPDKVGVNSLTDRQLNELVGYMLSTRIRSGPMRGRIMVQKVGGARNIVDGQAVYMTNFLSSPYPRIHVPKHLWDTWNPQPTTQDYLIHLVFWRWMNGRKCSLDPEIQVSHLVCYRGPDPLLKSENFLLLKEEEKVVNESRKSCWNTHPSLDFIGRGVCPHKTKCRLVDWSFPIDQ